MCTWHWGLLTLVPLPVGGPPSRLGETGSTLDLPPHHLQVPLVLQLSVTFAVRIRFHLCGCCLATPARGQDHLSGIFSESLGVF